MILQAAWIRKLLIRDDIEPEAIEYTPIYVLGNLCICKSYYTGQVPFPTEIL